MIADSPRPSDADADARFMAQAIELAGRGCGSVEPNPPVGCVLVREGRVLATGWHRRFGGPHAEVEALSQLAADDSVGCTAYVSLEPCCHHGKTPPCVDALIRAAVARVVVGARDPNPLVAGRGVAALRAAGIEVVEGVLSRDAERLIAPFAMLMRQERPWIHAKWAMTLDGKLATRTGVSQWISNEASRAVVHRLRGQVDAILVGRGTALADDPLLTARPPGPRTPARIVLDTLARLPLESRLVRSASEAPVIVATGPDASPAACGALVQAGVEVLALPSSDPALRMQQLVQELGRRRMTHLLVEGGAAVFGTLADLGLIDEVHAFIAPLLAGGADAPSPLAGVGVAAMSAAQRLEVLACERLDDDFYVRGRVVRAIEPCGPPPETVTPRPTA